MKNLLKYLLICSFLVFTALFLIACKNSIDNKGDSSSSVTLKLSYTKKYAEIGTAVKVPAVISYDNNSGEALNYSAALLYNNKRIQLSGNESFVPDKLGKYTYKVTMLDDEMITCEAIIEVVDKADRKLEIVAELGEEYGLNQAHNFIGCNAEYTNEKSYNESGSLKISSNNDNLTDLQFLLKNVYIEDITNYNSIYFYVYNDSNFTLTISLNYGVFDVALPKQWTKVVFNDLSGLGKNSLNSIFKENFSLDSINGLTIGIYLEEWIGMGNFDVFISSVYAIKPMTPSEVLSAIQKIPEVLTESDIENFLYATDIFNDRLSYDSQQVIVTHYHNMIEKYINYLKKQNNIVIENNKSFYFDTEFGLQQIKTEFGTAQISNEFVYENEEASLKLITNENWLSSINLFLSERREIMKLITTETIISGKVYCVTAECSPTATETVEKKLERLVCRHVSDSENYQTKELETLDISEIVREYTTNAIVKE